jgi:hypothetical protein
MFGLLPLARNRALSLLSVPIDCHFAPRFGELLLAATVFRRPQTQQCCLGVSLVAIGLFMSNSVRAHSSKKKLQPAKAIPQAKVEPKPQPTGLSREEIRQIVLEMIG